jgi:hypothetical protein
MKKIYLIFFTFLLTFSAHSQCSDVLIDSARTRLGEAQYLNVFRIMLKKGKKKNIPIANFKIQMSKGNIYRFIVAEAQENEEILIATLSDDYNKYGESYDKFEHVNFKGFDFKCTKTGFYYLSAYFKNGRPGCGVVVMSLLKVQNQYIR